MKLKRIGLKAGVADYVWMIGPNGQCVFIEFKAGSGDQTAAQKAFEFDCKLSGAIYRVFYTWTEAAHFMALLLFQRNTITKNTYTRLRGQLV